MTAEALPPEKEYAGNGTTVDFAVRWRFLPGTLLVDRIAADGTVTRLTEGIHYAVAGGDTDVGGMLTMVVAPASGQRLRIRRFTTRSQQSDYETSDNFPAATLEDNIDRAMLIAQEQDVKIDDVSARSPLVPEGEIAPQFASLADLEEGDVLVYRDGKLNRHERAAFAGKFLAGDATGALVPASGTGADAALRPDLADDDFGAKLVKYRGVTVFTRLAQELYLTDGPNPGSCNAAWDGLTLTGSDDLDSILQKISDAPPGKKLIIPGPTLITDTLSINKVMDVICPDQASAIWLGMDDVTKNGVVIGPGDNGHANAYHRAEYRLNVFGPDLACKNGIVLNRVDRSTLFINVRTGTSTTADPLTEVEGFALVLNGGLENEGRIYCSPYYTPDGAGMQTDNVLIKSDEGNVVDHQSNEYFVVIEGIGRHGIVAHAQNVGGGKNVFRGCIQGISGRPWDLRGQAGVDISNVWVEACGEEGYFYDCAMLDLRNVRPTNTTGEDLLHIDNSQVPRVDGLLYGRLKISDLTSGGVGGSMLVYEAKDVAGEGYGGNFEQQGPIASVTGGNVFFGGAGGFTMENIFHNPFLDIWRAGATSAPDGCFLNGCGVQRYATDFAGARGVYMAGVTQTVAGALQGFGMTPRSPFLISAQDRFVAVSIPVRADTTGGLRIVINGQVAWESIVSGAWQMARCAARVPAGEGLSVHITGWDGAAYSTGTFAVGGCSMVLGVRSPKYLLDSGRREEYLQLVASAAYDWPSLAAGTRQTTTLAVPDAALGDFVTAVASTALLAGTRLQGEFTAGATATITQENPTGGAVDVGAATISLFGRKNI